MEKLSPIIGWHYDFALLVTKKLSMVHSSRLLHYSGNVIEAANISDSKLPLQHPKPSIREELCMAHREERYGYLLMLASQNSPHQVVHYI